MTLAENRARAAKSIGPTDAELATTRPGTPGGKFMRQFWIAVERADDLLPGRTKPIRIMSEDYTLYRGESGKARRAHASRLGRGG